jgi:hypothetical protein
MRLLCYASEASILMRSLSVSSVWDVVSLLAGRVLVVNPSKLTQLSQRPFIFHGIAS